VICSTTWDKLSKLLRRIHRSTYIGFGKYFTYDEDIQSVFNGLINLLNERNCINIVPRNEKYYVIYKTSRLEGIVYKDQILLKNMLSQKTIIQIKL
jgi:hypothetical protein